MIAFREYFYFAAKEVEYIECSGNTDINYPYRLSVHLKSGKICSVNFADAQSRETERNKMVRQIEHEQRADAEKTYNLLALLRDAVQRIDKRQLRIWRQLKVLLGVPMEEDKE